QQLAWWAAWAWGASLAQDLVVARSAQPLAQSATQLAPASNAPDTVLQPQHVPGSLAPRAPATQLQPSRGAQTILRQAEVPPHRLEQTRALLVELKAQATPQQAISIDLPADVLFDFDQARLRPDAAPSIARAAE